MYTIAISSTIVIIPGVTFTGNSKKKTYMVAQNRNHKVKIFSMSQAEQKTWSKWSILYSKFWAEFKMFLQLLYAYSMDFCLQAFFFIYYFILLFFFSMILKNMMEAIWSLLLVNSFISQ